MVVDAQPNGNRAGEGARGYRSGRDGSPSSEPTNGDPSTSPDGSHPCGAVASATFDFSLNDAQAPPHTSATIIETNATSSTSASRSAPATSSSCHRDTVA